MASMTIRALDPERDAPRMVELILATNPTAVTNTEEWLHRRRTIPARAQLFSRVAQADERIVGVVEAGLNFFGSGDVASLGVRVDTDDRTRGVGSELYSLGLEHVLDLGAQEATTLSSTRPEGVAFASRRGWMHDRAEILPRSTSAEVPERPDKTIEIVPPGTSTRATCTASTKEATRTCRRRDDPGHRLRRVARIRLAQPALHPRWQLRGAHRRARRRGLAPPREHRRRPRSQHVHRHQPRAPRPGLAYAVKLAATRWAAENGMTQV